MSRKIVFLASNFLILPLFLCLASQHANSQERLWVSSDPNTTPKTVSIGDGGGQVFGPIEFGQDNAKLFTEFSSGETLPVWQNNLPIAGSNIEAASAETTNIHVVLTQVMQNNNNSTRITEIRKYTSNSATPDWSYQFPGVTAGLGKIGISSNGQRIVASSLYPFEQRLAVAVFSPNSGTPVSTFNITNFGVHLRGFGVSADGSTLYLSSNGYVRIYNLANNSLIYTVVLPGMFDGHALCGNGQGFAWGEFNRIHFYHRDSSGNFSQTLNYYVPGTWIVDRLALSDDCTTLVAGWHEYTQNLSIRIQALDVATGSELMSDSCTGTGTLQNIVSKVDISSDGSRIAAGLWGDEGNICPELRVYNRDSNTPYYTQNYPGSIYALDMNAAGTRVALALKPVHANTFAGGGSFELHALDYEDLRFIGVPRPGASMTVQMRHMPANSPTRLLLANSVLSEPVFMGSIGYLFLPRLSVNPMLFPNTNSQGVASGTYQIPAGAPGQNKYFQGVSLFPRLLTNNFVHMRTLP